MANDKGKGHRLDPKYLGQFKNPEVQAKIKRVKAEKREKLAQEAKAIQDAISVGYDSSELSNPDTQTALLNELTEIALSTGHNDQKWAMDCLIKHGAFKMPKQEEAKKGSGSDNDLDNALDVLNIKNKKNDPKK